MNSESKTPVSLLQDIRLTFATILTDPGSSLAYGADAVVAITTALLQYNYNSGLVATLTVGFIIMSVYLIAMLVYTSMTKHHVHPTLGGGAFVSSFITAKRIQNPRLKSFVKTLGKIGTASLLADFPATQAISLIAGVEALYFIPTEDRFQWAICFLIFISLIQRYGLGNLARYMIWPVIFFYLCNLAIQFVGLYEILSQGWEKPTLISIQDKSGIQFWPVILGAVANGATLITGVEVGYSSVNLPHHKGKAIRISMWLLFFIILVTYSLQLINFLGLGINQNVYLGSNVPPLPLQIAQHLGGDYIAIPFGLLTAIMLLLAAQTAQSDFPLEMLRASRSNFFPKGVGDTAWRKVRPALGLGGHHGVYNPRSIILLGFMSIVIIYFFPHSHDIESMYGLAVVTAICVDIGSYLLRQIRVRRSFSLTIIAFMIMVFMLLNILYNKFFEGAWFIVLLMILYLFIFLFSEGLYGLWNEKINLIPMELGINYPAFSNLQIDQDNIVLVSKFHPGVIHFLKNYIKKKHMPLVVHFQTEPDEKLPKELPDWFKNIEVSTDTDMITAIINFVREKKPNRVHLIPLLVKGIDPIRQHYFGNSIEQLKIAVSEYADVQVEYNRERIIITAREVLEQVFPYFKNRRLKRQYKKKT